MKLTVKKLTGFLTTFVTALTAVFLWFAPISNATNTTINLQYTRYNFAHIYASKGYHYVKFTCTNSHNAAQALDTYRYDKNHYVLVKSRTITCKSTGTVVLEAYTSSTSAANYYTFIWTNEHDWNKSTTKINPLLINV